MDKGKLVVQEDKEEEQQQKEGRSEAMDKGKLVVQEDKDEEQQQKEGRSEAMDKEKLIVQEDKEEEQQQKEGICSLCLEPVLRDESDRSVTKLQCNHEFHQDCIGSAFNVKNSMECPICRQVQQENWIQTTETNSSDAPEVPNVANPNYSGIVWAHRYQWYPLHLFQHVASLLSEDGSCKARNHAIAAPAAAAAAAAASQNGSSSTAAAQAASGGGSPSIRQRPSELLNLNVHRQQRQPALSVTASSSSTSAEHNTLQFQSGLLRNQALEQRMPQGYIMQPPTIYPSYFRAVGPPRIPVRGEVMGHPVNPASNSSSHHTFPFQQAAPPPPVQAPAVPYMHLGGMYPGGIIWNEQDNNIIRLPLPPARLNNVPPVALTVVPDAESPWWAPFTGYQYQYQHSLRAAAAAAAAASVPMPVNLLPGQMPANHGGAPNNRFQGLPNRGMPPQQ